MIDFIKALVVEANVNNLRNSRYLDFIGTHNEKTGEVGYTTGRMPRSIAVYQGLKFTIYENGKVYLAGSLHKYWNQGLQNYNDFTLAAINEVLKDLESKFNITPLQLVLQNFEIGVNIIPPYPTEKILQYCFMHRTNELAWGMNTSKGQYKQAEYQQYIIKIYDKARQYREQGLNVPCNEILRFEIKYMKEAKFPGGIKKLQDLLDGKLSIFADILAQEWQNILFFDFTLTSNSERVIKYSNPVKWVEMKNRPSDSAFKKHRRQLKKLIENESENIPQQVETLIRDKVKQLLEWGTQINSTSSQYRGTHINNTTNKGGVWNKTNKGTRINHLDKVVNQAPQEKSFCIVTGIDISMQRAGSKLLGIGGLKYYLVHNPDLFWQIIGTYLPDSHKNSAIEKKIFETYHAIRDKARPSRKTRASKYNPQQLKTGLTHDFEA